MFSQERSVIRSSPAQGQWGMLKHTLKKPSAGFLGSVLQSLIIGGSLLIAAPTTANAQSFELVFRAFIPNAHPSNPGFVRPVPGQAGRSMIPGPGIPFVVAPLPIIGSCYNTNDRGFSSAADASAKASSTFRFSLVNGVFDPGSVQHDVDVTQRFDCETGRVTGEALADKAGVTALPATRLGDIINITLATKAINPLISAPDVVVPGITWGGVISVDTQRQRVRFIGRISDFPSFEAYLRVDGGPPITILNESPAGGSTAWSLLNERSVDVEVPYFALEGRWNYSSTGTLTFRGDTVTLRRAHCGTIQELSLPFQRLPQGARITLPTNLTTFPCGRPPALRANMVQASQGHPTVYELNVSGTSATVSRRQPGFDWDANYRITNVYYIAPNSWPAGRN